MFQRDEKYRLAVVALTMLLFAASAFSQSAQTGAITGEVKDANGAVVLGAKVEIYNEATGRLERSLATGGDGTYTATLLRPGNYRVEISASGFKKYQGVGVQVRLGETTRQDAALELGQVMETIVVEATPTLINPVSAVTGQAVDSHTLTALPLAVPNFLFLLTLSPGAAGEPPDVRNANRGIVDINVNGQRTSNNSVSLEGVNVNDFNLAHFDTIPLPNPDTIEEFKVATSLYDASQGTKGGGALGLVLKSGTKNLHGSAYWQHRNDVLNANEWFRNQSGSPRARLLQNVFGGSGSGPIWKLGGFWFANYQGVRTRNGIDPSGSTSVVTIPKLTTAADGTVSAASLAADASAGLITPLTAAQIDPIAVNILNLQKNIYGGNFVVPRPGQPGCPAVAPAGPPVSTTYRCTLSKIAPLTDNQFTISYDRSMRQDKDKISTRWFYDNGQVTKPLGTDTTLKFPRDDGQSNRFVTIAHTHLFSSRQTNEFRFGFSRFNASQVPSDLITLDDIGATRPNKSSVPGIYRIEITNLFSLGTGVNDQRATVSNSFYWSDNWSFTLGKHTFRAGGEIVRYQLNRTNQFAIRGSLIANATTGTGNDFSPFQNFVQGRIRDIQSGAGNPQRYFRDTDAAAYFQDDWRVFPRLTVNLGLRWEGLGSSHDKFFRNTNYDPTLLAASPPQNPYLYPASLNLEGFTGTPGVSDCAINTCFNTRNFGPRIGFAWDALGNQKTIVRGGFGIYYQRLSNQNVLQGSLGAPFFVQLINSNPTPPSFQLQNPLPTQPPTTAIATQFIPQVARFAGLFNTATGMVTTNPADVNLATVVPIFVNQAGQQCKNFPNPSVGADNCVINLASFASAALNSRPPYTEQWNLTVQRDLWRGWAVEVGYVGSHYVGGIGIWSPFLARLASPVNPVTVTDINGTSYTITTNTSNNVPLREGILGLSRKQGGDRIDGDIGQAVYHSAQVTVLHRFRGGLFFQGAYTFSKTIDNVSGSQSTDELNATRAGQAGGNILNFQNDPGQNRARGDFDRPHSFVASYSWDLPLPRSSIWGSQAFQGWTISGIVTYQTGLPFSILDTAGGAFGGGASTPVLACNLAQIPSLPACTGTPTSAQQALLPGSIQSRLDHYVNPNFFIQVPSVPNAAGAGATGYGNVPRNAFRAPFQQNWDFSVSKRFKITERHNFSFRADFFNLFNHPVFQTPSFVNISSTATFARINGTAIPQRLIQFGLRYDF